ncbi:HlyD family efflux transporter periplasmic adaptor subunit [Colwellia sp. D2M02]|uniref:efflux RND transporter periplasmic adaptor subunit n=1 Tax=Colwellia sp. D2M02 TaxID=2841562 RepID=UPI001C08971F|nr:HlyD family efflux transporter periplasmic adaptor subunit [Colwellia sp. D2M02]MBU2892211.1 HlyD family efflux transporter periplasmic adaptor subunit [Colwellia sp. D2M02]
MDLTTTLHKKTTASKKRNVLLTVVVLVTLLLLLGFSSINKHPQVELSTLRIAEVKQGDFKVNIAGYGRLKAKYQRLLTSQNQAIVDSIKLYPGAKVTEDSVIMTLSAPQLEQDVINAKLELARQNAEFNQQIIAHKSQLLEHDAQIALLMSELENAQLRATAEQKLIDKGIVSALDFKRSQLAVRQLEQRVAIEKTRQTHLKSMQVERMKISKDLITQYQHNFAMIQKRFEHLTVRAGLNGVLQTLPVEIGQSLTAGTQLAVIGSDQQLVAQLRVQQNQADQIAIGMEASIQTSGHSIAAKVIRIDPVITEGRVMVELDLIGELPANARPDLTVEGKVHVKNISNALYVEQPSHVYGFTEKNIYVLSHATSDSQLTAQLTTLEFGTLSGNKVEIVKGVKRGDNIIISDISQWSESQQQLLINQ